MALHFEITENEHCIAETYLAITSTENKSRYIAGKTTLSS